ncbi:UDP-N-acetylmuramate dehydrogenase [Neobacillus muris]|uniref:UDP-N-acetylmuramate dehydrogenase n=1 Tax=Neobacillus muris TaxID=2941334 RepID=UPI00203A84AE|nr:UDP-N-acetylmuramate dehydrogenase [Neobacillus muris]
MSGSQKWINRLQQILPVENIKVSESIKNYTYTRLGGPADIFLTPTNFDEMKVILQTAKECDIPVTIIGNGSNLIVKDGGIRGITISLMKMKAIKVVNQTLSLQAGAYLKHVTEAALRNELTGLEFASGIPGTVGGAVYMNAGAYGGQISDALTNAWVMDGDGHLLLLSKQELLFGYRNSIISDKKFIVLEAEFQLEKSRYEVIKEKMEKYRLAREKKQPLEYPSCGSVFKRPAGYFAGKLIQDSGLQGLRIGGAEVSVKHAGFIVNVDNASSKDYTDLIKVIQETVKQKFGVELETEVIILG